MTYIIVPSKKFQKALKKYHKGGMKRIVNFAEEVIELLSVRDRRAFYVLGTRRDHELAGSKHGIRELHLSQNDLLLYSVDDAQKFIKLLDIVNHEDLRKQ